MRSTEVVFVLFCFTLCSEIIIDSQEFAKIIQRGPMYPHTVPPMVVSYITIISKPGN